MATVRLLTDAMHPAYWWMGKGAPTYFKGEIVEVVPASNVPKYVYWINEPECRNDCYGIGLQQGEYELLEG
jgi:hypothetical protein